VEIDTFRMQLLVLSLCISTHSDRMRIVLFNCTFRFQLQNKLYINFYIYLFFLLISLLSGCNKLWEKKVASKRFTMKAICAHKLFYIFVCSHTHKKEFIECCIKFYVVIYDFIERKKHKKQAFRVRNTFERKFYYFYES
jgi:hypothetical protein